MTAPDPPRFPPLTASNLSGRRLALPADFAGVVNMLLVGFAREQQPVIDTWLPFARALREREPRVRFYELPTISRAYQFMSPLIAGGMRAGIPDAGARDVTVTLYVDVPRFRLALGLPDDAAAHVLLLDRGAAVRWHAAGPFSEASGAAALAAVAELLAAEGA